MSTQAACRPLTTTPLLTMRPIEEKAWYDTGVRKAVDALDKGSYSRWRQVDPADGEWDDLLDEVSGFGPPPSGSRFEAALLALAECSEECIIWYPGDDFLEVPVVNDEREFAAAITEMVARGNIEPKLRFVRRPQTRRRAPDLR